MSCDKPRPGMTRSFPGTTQQTRVDCEHPTCAVFLVSETGSLILPSNWNGPRIRLLGPDPPATRLLPHRPPPTHVRVAVCHQTTVALGHPSISQSRAEPLESTHAECLSSGRKVWLISVSLQLGDPVLKTSLFWPCATVSSLLSHALAQASPVYEPDALHCPRPLDFVVASRDQATVLVRNASAASSSGCAPSSAIEPVLRIHFSSFAPDAQPSTILDADHLDSGILLAVHTLLQDVAAQPSRSYRSRDSATTSSHGPLFKPVVVRTSLGPRSGWCLRLIDGVLLAIQTTVCQGACGNHAEVVDVATLDPDTLSMPSPLRSFFKSSSGSSNGSNSSEGSHGLASAGPQRVMTVAPSDGEAAPPVPISRQLYRSDAASTSQLPSPSRNTSPILDLMSLSSSLTAHATGPPPPSPNFRAPGRPAPRGRTISRGGSSRADANTSSSAPAFLDAPYSFTLSNSTLPSMIRSPSSGPSFPIALAFSTMSPDSAPVRRSRSTSELFRIARRQRELLANMVQRHRNDTADSSRSSLGQLPQADHQPNSNSSRASVSASRPPTVNVVAATPRSSTSIAQPEACVSTLSATGEIDLSSLDDLFAAPRRGFHTSLATASFRAVPPATDEPTGDPMQGFGGRNAGTRRLKEPPEPGMRCARCSRTESPEWRRGPDGQRNLCNACGLKYARTLRSAVTTETALPGSPSTSSSASSATSSSTLATSSSGGNSTPQQVTLERGRDSAIGGISAPSTTSSTRGSASQLGPAGSVRLRMAGIDGSIDDPTDTQPPLEARHQNSPSPQPRPGA